MVLLTSFTRAASSTGGRAKSKFTYQFAKLLPPPTNRFLIFTSVALPAFERLLLRDAGHDDQGAEKDSQKPDAP